MVKAIKSACKAMVHYFLPATPIRAHLADLIVVSASGNVLDMGKRYHLTSGRAPIFSLFTFFMDW